MFLYQGENPANDFVGKSKEKNLADLMRKGFGLVKKSHGYAISSILDEAMKFTTQVMA